MSRLGSSFRKFDSWKLTKVVMVFEKHMCKQHRPASHSLVAKKKNFFFLTFSNFFDATEPEAWPRSGRSGTAADW